MMTFGITFDLIISTIVSIDFHYLDHKNCSDCKIFSHLCRIKKKKFQGSDLEDKMQIDVFQFV